MKSRKISQENTGKDQNFIADEGGIRDHGSNPTVSGVAVIGAGNLDILAVPVTSEVFEKGTQPADAVRISTGGDAFNEAIVLSLLYEVCPDWTSGIPQTSDRQDSSDNINNSDSPAKSQPRQEKTDDLQHKRSRKKSPFYPVHWISTLHNDQAGNLILNKAEDHHIRTTISPCFYPTSVNIVLVEPDGERSFITSPKTSLRMLSKADIPEFEDPIVCLASLFVSHKLSLEDAAVLMKKWKSQNKITCMDMTTAKNNEKASDMKGLFENLDYLFCNQKEAQSITGFSNPAFSAAALLDAGAGCVLIKLGKEGVLIGSQNKNGPDFIFDKNEMIRWAKAAVFMNRMADKDTDDTGPSETGTDVMGTDEIDIKSKSCENSADKDRISGGMPKSRQKKLSNPVWSQEENREQGPSSCPFAVFQKIASPEGKTYELFRFPALVNEFPADTTGCGDSFAAGFLYGLAHHLSFGSCVFLAMECGRAASEALGASTAFENPERVRMIFERLSSFAKVENKLQNPNS